MADLVNPWAETDPKAETAKQLRESAERLIAEADKLERQAKEEAKKKLPPNPTTNFWRVDVQFSQWGATYTFLLLKHGTTWYTTGQDARTQKFTSWTKLWEWLEGPDVYAHSRLQKLTHVAGSEEIEHGTKPVLGIRGSVGTRW